MNNSLPHTRTVRRELPTVVTPLHVLVLLSLCLGVTIWGAASIFAGQGLQFQRYLALLAFFAIACTAFVVSRIRMGKLQLFEIPVYITCLFFLQFGLLPLRNFIDPKVMGRHLSPDGDELVQALSYCVLGMMGFWMGCQAAGRREGGQACFGPSAEGTSHGPRQGRRMLFAIALSGVAIATRLFLLGAHLYSYMASMEKYFANLASMQVANFVAGFATLALVVASIERYRNRSDPNWNVAFWAILLSEVVWGAISGMKGPILQSFVVVALVSSVVQRRLNLQWLLLPLFGLILLYPVSDAYRGLVRGRGTEAVTSLREAGRAGRMALQDAAQQTGGARSIWQVGLALTVQRLELLTSIAQVLTLDARARSFVRGDVRWWMVPIYPFIPRFIWPSKPILLESARFTIVLGGGRASDITKGISSTAITYPGDLYLHFGLLGIPVGMFLLGLVAQWLTSRLSGPMGERDLFVYANFFLFGFPLESDVFSVWSSLIKLLAILLVLSWVIYGPRRRPARVVG